MKIMLPYMSNVVLSLATNYSQCMRFCCSITINCCCETVWLFIRFTWRWLHTRASASRIACAVHMACVCDRRRASSRASMLFGCAVFFFSSVFCILSFFDLLSQSQLSRLCTGPPFRVDFVHHCDRLFTFTRMRLIWLERQRQPYGRFGIRLFDRPPPTIRMRKTEERFYLHQCVCRKAIRTGRLYVYTHGTQVCERTGELTQTEATATS